MARVAKKKPPKPVVHNPAAPPAVQAAQLGLRIMKILGVGDWKQVVALPTETLRDKVVLTNEQQGILEGHRSVLPHLRISPLVTIAACDTCGLRALAGAAVVSQKCPYTLGCPGRVFKASTVDYAKREKPPTVTA